MELTNIFYPCTEDGKEISNSDAPENNPQYTTVYVGNLGSEVRNFLYLYISIFGGKKKKQPLLR